MARRTPEMNDSRSIFSAKLIEANEMALEQNLHLTHTWPQVLSLETLGNESVLLGRTCPYSGDSPAALEQRICFNDIDCVISIESSKMQVLFSNDSKVNCFVFLTGTNRVIYREHVCPCNRNHEAGDKFSIVVNLVKKGCLCYSCVTRCYNYSGKANFTTRLLIFNHIWCNVVSSVNCDPDLIVHIYLHLLLYVISQRLTYCPRWISYNSGSSEEELFIDISQFPSYSSLLFSFFDLHGSMNPELMDQIVLLRNPEPPVICKELGSYSVKTVNYRHVTKVRSLWPGKTEDITKIKGWRKKVFHPYFLAFLKEEKGTLRSLKARLMGVFNQSVKDDQVLRKLEQTANERERDSDSAFKAVHLDRYLTEQCQLRVSFPIPKAFASGNQSNRVIEFRDSASSSKDESKESMYPVMPQNQSDDNPTSKCVTMSIKVSDRKHVMVQERPIPVSTSKYRTVKRKFISSVPKTDTKAECYKRYKIPFPLKTRTDDFEPNFPPDSFRELNEDDIRKEMQEEALLIEEKEEDSIHDIASDGRCKKQGGARKTRQFCLLNNAYDNQDAFQKRLKLPSEEDILLLTKAYAEDLTIFCVSDFIDLSEPRRKTSSAWSRDSSLSGDSEIPPGFLRSSSQVVPPSPFLYNSSSNDDASSIVTLPPCSSKFRTDSSQASTESATPTFSTSPRQCIVISSSRSNSLSDLSQVSTEAVYSRGSSPFSNHQMMSKMMSSWSSRSEFGLDQVSIIPVDEVPIFVDSTPLSTEFSQSEFDQVNQVLVDIKSFVVRNMEIPEFDFDPDLPSASDEPVVLKKDEKEKKSKMERELRKLVNVSVVDETLVDDCLSESADGKSSCDKEFCAKGCVCFCFDWKPPSLFHCGKSKCMFRCNCPLGKLVGSADFDSSLAKEEQTWHQLFVKRKDKGIELLTNSKDKIKREKKLPQRFENHVVGKDVNNIEQMRRSPEPKLKRYRNSEVKDLPDTRNSDSENSGSNQAPSRIAKRRRLEEESNELSSLQDLDREESKPLRERRLKLGYIARKSNPKLVDVAIWCAEHTLYNCLCVNWVVMLKNNALVWKPETDESLSLSEMKDIRLNKSEYDAEIIVFDPNQDCSRTHGSFYDYSTRNASKFFRAKLESELDNRLTFSNGFVKMKILAAVKRTECESLRPADQNMRFSRECKYVEVVKTDEDVNVDIVGEHVKPRGLDSKSQSNGGKKLMEGAHSIAPSTSPHLTAENVKVNEKPELLTPKDRAFKSKSNGLKSKTVDPRTPSLPVLPSSSTARVTPDPSVTSRIRPPSPLVSHSSPSPPPTSETIQLVPPISHSKPPSSSRCSLPSRQTPSPTEAARQKRKTKSSVEHPPADPLNGQSEFKKPKPSSVKPRKKKRDNSERLNELRCSTPSHVPETTPTLPDLALLCLNPDFGFLKIYDFSPSKVVLDDPEHPGYLHVFSHVEAANVWLNKFLKSRMTFCPSHLVLKWVMVKPGVLKLKGTLPFNPQILKRENIVTEDEIIIFPDMSPTKTDVTTKNEKPDQATRTTNKLAKPIPFTKKDKVELTSKDLPQASTKSDSQRVVKDSQKSKSAFKGFSSPLNRHFRPSKRSEVDLVPNPYRLRNSKQPKSIRSSSEKTGNSKFPYPRIASRETDRKKSKPIRTRDQREEPDIIEIVKTVPPELYDKVSLKRQNSLPVDVSHGCEKKKFLVDRRLVPFPKNETESAKFSRTPLKVPCKPNVILLPSEDASMKKKEVPPSESVSPCTSPEPAHVQHQGSPFSIVSQPIFAQAKINTPIVTSEPKMVSLRGGPIQSDLRLRVPVYAYQPTYVPVSIATSFVPKTSQEPLKDIAIPTNFGRKILPAPPEALTGGAEPAKRLPSLIKNNSMKKVVVKDGTPGYYDQNKMFQPLKIGHVIPSLVRKY